MRLARLAFALAPMEERMAVMHVPMLLPKTRNSTSLPPFPMTSPCPTMTMTSEVTADDDCTIAVKIMPKIRSRKGLLTMVRKFLNSGLSL